MEFSIGPQTFLLLIGLHEVHLENVNGEKGLRLRPDEALELQTYGCVCLNRDGDTINIVHPKLIALLGGNRSNGRISTSVH